MNNQEQPTTLSTIKQLNDDTVYRASVHFYSKGRGEDVTLAVDVSHILDDEFVEEKIPTSYAQVYELVMGLRRNAVLYTASDDDNVFLTNPDVSPEAKAEMLLEKARAQEEALTATIN